MFLCKTIIAFTLIIFFLKDIVFCFVVSQASTKHKKVNVRSGPGKEFDIIFIILSNEWPIKILKKIGEWIKIKDALGNIGWIHKNSLSNKKYILITKKLIGKYGIYINQHHLKDMELSTNIKNGECVLEERKFIPLHSQSNIGSKIIAYLEEGLILKYHQSENKSFKISVLNIENKKLYKGFVILQ